MKKYFLMLLIVPILIFSGCTQNAGGVDQSNSKASITPPEKSSSTASGDLDEERVREIAREEIAQADLSKQIESGIDAFVKKQEEEAQKAQDEANKPTKVEGVSVDDDPFIGDPNAPVTIVEFSDFQCPYCGRHATTVFPEIKEKYIDTGKVKYVFRDFPLGFHPNAIPAAVAANCVRDQSDDETFFKFHDLLYADQQNLDEETFKKYAKDLGLDETEFAACLEKNDTSEIEADMKDGAEYGVSGTPGFFINGWQIKGAYPFSAFEELIEQELAAQ